MEVILKKDVENLGSAYEIVTVKNGYGRNFLIPRGMAILATDAAKKMHEETLRQRAHKEAKMKEDAEQLAKQLEGVTLTITTKAGTSGKIFGSVNTVQIAEALAVKGHNVERKRISIKNEPIKELGTFDAEIKLHKEVTATVKFEVVGESAM